VQPNLALLENASEVPSVPGSESTWSPRPGPREGTADPAGLDGAEVAVCRGPNGTAIGTQGVPRALIGRVLDHPESLIRRGLGRPVKISRGCVLVEARLSIGGQDVAVAFKQYRPRNGWKALCRLVGRNPARRDWVAARRLVALGIATARPILLVEPRRPWLGRRSYLATEWIAGSQNLHLYGWKLSELPLRERLARAARCAEGLGRLIGRLHGRGVAHRDLKGANLLVVDRAGRISTWLVDVAGARFVGRLSDQRRARNLARLAVGLEAHPWVNRAVCCRFLRAYLRELPAPEADWKALWHAVAAESRRLRAKMQRRGEPLL
jgi:tRNA A-37 threonylcarbamoyl transferase component Bud32